MNVLPTLRSELRVRVLLFVSVAAIAFFIIGLDRGFRAPPPPPLINLPTQPGDAAATDPIVAQLQRFRAEIAKHDKQKLSADQLEILKELDQLAAALERHALSRPPTKSTRIPTAKDDLAALRTIFMGVLVAP